MASPRPKRVVELESIRTLLDHGTVVVAGGGGGIPVAAQGNALKGVGAVVDKDFTAALLARELDAQVLLILTGVAGVAVHYGKPNQRQLTHMTVPVAREYLARGEFAAGSMGPKVAAGAEFAQSGPGRRCVITDLSHAADALRGQAGTTIGRVRTRRLAISLWQVSENSPPNRTYTFQRIRLSRRQSNFPACNLSWQGTQSAIVLRLRPIIAISHCFLPLKSLSFRTWCTSIGTFSAPHHSH